MSEQRVRDICQIRLKAVGSPRLGRTTYAIVAMTPDADGLREIARSASFKLWEPEAGLWGVPKAARAAADVLALALEADGWTPFSRYLSTWWAMFGERPLPGARVAPDPDAPVADPSAPHGSDRPGDAPSPSQRWFETLPCGEEPIASPLIAPRPVLRGW